MVCTWTMSSCTAELRIGLIALILAFICLFFLSFKATFVSRFSQELFKLESSIMECICKMSDQVVGLRNELIALFLLFFNHLSLFPISYVNI